MGRRVWGGRELGVQEEERQEGTETEPEGSPPRSPDLIPLGHKANTVEIGVRERGEGIQCLTFFGS